MRSEPFYSETEYADVVATSRGNQFGAGLTFAVGAEDTLIVSVIGNSPAERGGMRPGEFVRVCVAADGTRAEIEDGDDFSAFISARAEGEQFTVVTDRGEHVVYRGAYTMSYCAMATADAEWSVRYDGDGARTVVRSESSRYSYLPEGAAYVSLSQFYGDAAEEMAQLIYRYNEEGCTSLILDLRNDGGGLVSAMQGISGCFEGPAGEVVMTARYKDGSSESYAAASYSAEQTIGSDVDVYVLANSNTASASEALIGALVSYEVLDYNNIYISQYSQEYLDSMNVTAEQVKSGKTYGKGIMQTTFRNFATGEALKLTTAQIYWANNKTIHGVGLTAEDGCNMVEAPAPLSGDGEELRAAVGMIYGL